ncbi:hypothetical protein OIU78_003177 [Salix suchowensis]|nr:hypothetical protein OIU78_003177 [Salix suchowensis]
MLRLLFCLALILEASSVASAAIVEHSFHVQNLTVRPLCTAQVVTAVNGSLPGPTLRVREGDTLVVHVFNKSPYNMTIHWHGVFQLFSAWADGAGMITQCPIPPGGKYTYKFKLLKQEGTLWWHAHVGSLRATVYGALIICPRSGQSYPFPKPDGEVPILLGEWWNANVVDVETQALATGIFKLKVQKGKTYLLRIINAALNTELFFKIANHKMTVVAVDASYTVPYITDVVVTGPGQTVDVLLAADQEVGSYYMAANAYVSDGGAPLNSTTRGIVLYEGGPHWVPVPRKIDEYIGIYTTDFPNTPPVKFDYTNDNINVLNPTLSITPKSTSVKVLKYNSTVEMVLQNTAIMGVENHPMHLHGFNFHVLAQGFGNYDPLKDPKKFNLINPQSRNTIGVPVGGWAVIRFMANNPGVWIMHCHLEVHVPWGLATAFVVENGPTKDSTLPPPPADLPQC